MKVYCKNCEFNKIAHIAGWQMEKNPPFNFYPYSELFCVFTNIYISCKDKRHLNYKNNCKKYKRKWWKFWVTPTHKQQGGE